MAKLIIHCSDSSYGNAVLIDQWHREKGWDCIGYNFVILNGVTVANGVYDENLDGMIETGRTMTVEGAHTFGHNHIGNIGVCLIGKSGVYSSYQLDALGTLSMWFPDHKIYQHSDLSHDKPNCAGLNIDKLIRGYWKR